MKIECKEGLIVLKDQDEEVGYIKYVRKEENVIDIEAKPEPPTPVSSRG